MDRDKLKELYNDKAMQDAWSEFIMEVLNVEALKRVYNGGDTTAVKETREIIKKSFIQLKENFEPKETREVTNKAL